MKQKFRLWLKFSAVVVLVRVWALIFLVTYDSFSCLVSLMTLVSTCFGVLLWAVHVASVWLIPRAAVWMLGSTVRLIGIWLKVLRAMLMLRLVRVRRWVRSEGLVLVGRIILRLSCRVGILVWLRSESIVVGKLVRVSLVYEMPVDIWIWLGSVVVKVSVRCRTS